VRRRRSPRIGGSSSRRTQLSCSAVPLGLRESQAPRKQRRARAPLIHTGSTWPAIYCSADTTGSTNVLHPLCPTDERAHGTRLGEPACRLRSNFSSSLLTTDTGRPTLGLSTFLLSPYPIRRREPQPPDVDHTSPKLATHRSLSSGTGSSGCCCCCRCWRRCLGSKTSTSATQLATEYRHCSRRRRLMISTSVGPAERTGERLTKWRYVSAKRTHRKCTEADGHNATWRKAITERETKGETNNKSARLVPVQRDDEKRISPGCNQKAESRTSAARRHVDVYTPSLSVPCKPSLLFRRCDLIFSFLGCFELLRGASGQPHASACL